MFVHRSEYTTQPLQVACGLAQEATTQSAGEPFFRGKYIGGFPHFAAHPFIWPVALGFRVENVPFHRLIGAPPGCPGDLPVPTPVGLERDGQVLIKPFCPPYYRDMEEAVLAFVDYKYAPGCGTFRDGGAVTAWRDGVAVQGGIPRYSDDAVAATIACCQYVHERYGRFPASSGPFRTVLAYQAHRLDEAFYRKFYHEGVLPDDAGDGA